MIELNINGTPVVMAKFFSSVDVESVVEKIVELGANQVLFLDTAPTAQLSEAIRQLQEMGVEVILRDHHDVIGEPETDRDQQIRSASNTVRGLLGDIAIISNRKQNPACSTLVEPGEFVGVDGLVVVADPDPDGLTASMKALGVSYPELDADAAVLDGARSQQTAENLSPMAMLLVKGMATLPPFNPKNPSFSEKAKGELFLTFVTAIQGNAEAKASLEVKVEAYEEGIRIAKELVSTSTEPITNLFLVDTVGSNRHDLMTLTRGLETKGAKVTCIRKEFGPIAAVHGTQYSLAVVKKFQEDINLQRLLPEGFESSPKAGIISNTTFLLHVSEQVWNEVVFPALQDMLA